MSQFLQARSIVAYIIDLEVKEGSVTKASAYLVREIMSTRLALAVLFEDCHSYSTIFLNVVHHLVCHLLVHEGTLALDKEERSAF